MIDVISVEQAMRKPLHLRRFADGRCPLMPGRHGYHQAMTYIGSIIDVSDDIHEYSKDDSRWPTQCACGYQFSNRDTWQVFPEKSPT